MNLELWTELKDAVFHRMGYRQACREVKELTELNGDMKDVERLRALHNGEKHMRNSSITGPYRKGWNQRWYDFGWTDARKGLCRARRYRNHFYNQGWTNSVVSMREDGERAAQLTEQFAEMQEHYWERIGNGKADDYYSMPG